MRREGDPLADSTVKAVFDKGTVAAVNELLTKLVRNDDIPAGPWPPELADYLRASARLPSWADAALIRTGENVFLRYGLTSFGILACASLPECYVLRDVAAVLGTTQRLDAHARRRIFETAMMVLAVMAEGGLAARRLGHPHRPESATDARRRPLPHPHPACDRGGRAAEQSGRHVVGAALAHRARHRRSARRIWPPCC